MPPLLDADVFLSAIMLRYAADACARCVSPLLLPPEAATRCCRRYVTLPDAATLTRATPPYYADATA